MKGTGRGEEGVCIGKRSDGGSWGQMMRMQVVQEGRERKGEAEREKEKEGVWTESEEDASVGVDWERGEDASGGWGVVGGGTGKNSGSRSCKSCILTCHSAISLPTI